MRSAPQTALLVGSLACLALGVPVLAVRALGGIMVLILPADVGAWLTTLQLATGVDVLDLAAAVLVAVGTLGVMVWALGQRVARRGAR